MKIIDRFYLKDIKEYERKNRVNLIKFFDDSFNLYNLIELIKLGNNVDDEHACMILEEYLGDEDKTIVDAYKEIRDALMGRQVNDNDVTNINTKEYESLTDIFHELCKQMLSFGISYTEFWNMSTDEVYKVADGMKDKHIEQLNEDLAKGHLMAGMFGAAVWGKLDKEPPQLELESDTDNSVIHTEEFGDLTPDEYNIVKSLGAIKPKE